MARQQLGVAPSQPLDTATKQYVDTAVAGASSGGAATYQTSNTQGTNAGQWTKFATIGVTAQYLDMEVMLRFLSAGDGSGTNGGAYAELRLRVKQQAAFGSNPILDVSVVQSNGQLNFDDFTAVVTSNAGPTMVDFYVNIDVAYRYWTFTQLNLARGDSAGTVAYLSNQPFLTTLPTGVLQQQAVNEVSAANQLLNPTLTGNAVAPTQTAGDSSTKIATTAFAATAATNAANTAASTKANIASPTFTGVPAAPTAAVNANSTQLATTAYADNGDRKLIGVSTKTAAYTFVLGDAGQQIEYNVAGTAATFTIPLNSSVAFPVGTVINLCNINTGALTIAGISGVTLVSPAGFRLTTQYATAAIVQRAANIWVLSGFTVV